MYAKIFYFNLYRKKGYGLSQYNVSMHKDEIMSRMRLEECERNMIFMLSEVRLEIFFNKIKK